MLLEIFIKGCVGLRFLLTLKMGHKGKKVEKHWYKVQHTLFICYLLTGSLALQLRFNINKEYVTPHIWYCQQGMS